MIRLLFALFLTVPATRAAAGELQALPVVLKQKAEVSGEYIRLGDLFSGLDAAADQTPAAPAPALGKDAILTAEWLKQLAKKHGIDWTPTPDQSTATVHRAADKIGEDEVKAALTAALREKGLPETADLLIQKGDLPLLVPARSDWRLEPTRAEYNAHRQTFEVETDLTVNREKLSSPVFSGKVRLFVTVPVARRDMKAGQIVTRDDIAANRIAQDGRRRIDPANIDDLIGKEIKRTVRAGQTITANDVQTQVMVAKGKVVTLNFSKGNIMLSAKGKALENGGLGDSVRVMNLQSKSVVQGTVTGPETVLIPAAGG